MKDLAHINEICAQFDCDPANLIAIMQEIQAADKYLSEQALTRVAENLHIGTAKVYSVATFYENFSLEPKGKYVIKCCDGTACHVRGSMPILNRLREELKLAEGKKTTEDLLFTLDTVHCLGACGLAPVIMINENVYPTMTPDAAAKLISDLREKENENA